MSNLANLEVINFNPQHDNAAGPYPEPDPIVYMLSSSAGFGHVSRAAALAPEFEQDTPVILAAHQNAHQFLNENMPAGSNIHIADMNYSFYMPSEEFAGINPYLMETAAGSQLVIHDFLPHIAAIRDTLDAKGSNAPHVGIYHSIEGYPVDDIEVRAFQDRFIQIASNLDYLFLTEPKAVHASPHQLESGTVVVPCDPVVRQPDMHPFQVKEELGLLPEDDFIYVQGGMLGSEELRDFVTSLDRLSIGGLKFVLAPSKSLGSTTIYGNNIYQMTHRPDAHNVVAASSGVISKPGMGILSEAINSRKPLLLVGSPNPEGKVKNEMLRQIVGDELPYELQMNKPVSYQIGRWLEAAAEISTKMSTVTCNGASVIARSLPAIANQTLRSAIA